MNFSNLGKKTGLAAIVAISTLTGAAGSATILNAVTAHAQTTPTVVTAQTAAPSVSADTNVSDGSTNHTFKSNEDPTHEKGESAAREAQEDAGQRPTVK